MLSNMEIDQSRLDGIRQSIDEESMNLLKITFEDTRSNFQGISADKFRVRHRDKRNLIDLLVSKGFITDPRYNAQNLFRVTWRGVLILDHPDANSLVSAMDSILVNLHARYIDAAESETVYVKELVDSLNFSEVLVLEALLLLNDMSAWSHGHSAGFPFGDDANIRTGECNLDMEGLNQLIRRNIEISQTVFHDQQSSLSLFGGFDEYSQEIKPHKVVKEPLFITLDSEQLPVDISKLVLQIELAFQMEMYFLVSLGIRAVTDMVITDIVGDIGGFKLKLKSLEKHNHITPKQFEALDATIDSGSASMHRGHFPTRDDVKTCAKVISQLMYQHYESSSKIKSLRENTPVRPKLSK